MAVGNLIGVPQRLSSCILTPPPRSYGGLSYNGAVKRTTAGNYLIATEIGHEPGRKPLHWYDCPVPEAEASELIQFKAVGLQLSGEELSVPKDLPVKISQLVRLVTRVK